jgi:hypothetical protein
MSLVRPASSARPNEHGSRYEGIGKSRESEAARSEAKRNCVRSFQYLRSTPMTRP